MDTQSPSSSSSFSSAFTYQVFLSFRGSDTRNGFTGNLYNALTKNGIHTFIDDNDLERGDEITPSLIKAIEESRIFIPIFSANYASSSFCLDELVHIIHCYKTKGRLVLPVFFGVDPTNVRHHTNSYGECLTKHEEKFKHKLDQWKMALTQAANFSGYHYSPPGYEYKFIEKIIKDIFDKINRVYLHVAKYPVGLESQVQQVKSLLDEGNDDEVYMVGVYGIGGLGKSTLAKAIYNFIADQFEGLCFLEDVRVNSTPNNLKHLQEELLLKTVRLDIKLGGVSEGISIIEERLSRKKILLILDDVDDRKQLEALAGGIHWFGPGSRVIITTRDKHLLTFHGIERTYKLKGLYGTKALELLRWMAFKDIVPSSYEDILNRAVVYASGLPLVIEIVGSNLCGKSIEDWKGTLDGYETIPNKKIQEILKVSYDALEQEQQSVFLDIACCFKGCAWEEAENILNYHYGHHITHHLRVLYEKSLIDHQNYSHVTLHNLIEYMGKEIVRQESPKEPGERSRLWRQDDIVHVLKENTGTSKIEMIYMNFPSMESIIDEKGKTFKKMTELKTLTIENGHFSEGLKYLPSSLIVLKWERCLSESIPSSILNKKFQNMNVLTLDFCKYLTHIPDVSCLSNLEKFSFKFCENLITIDDSIRHQTKLKFVSAIHCYKLESFPLFWLASLKELKLTVCRSLNSWLTNKKEIELNDSSIGELPSSFQNLSELQNLSPLECGMLRFPKSQCIQMYSNLEYLCLANTHLSDECLEKVLKWCANLKRLDLHHNSFKILPECLSECHLIEILQLQSCLYLKEIRGIPPNLKYLDAMWCRSLSSLTRRMLLSQKLHEAGHTNIRFPNGSEGIPDWFEHQSRGPIFSFRFRNKIPSITSILLFPESGKFPRINLFVNGYFFSDYLFCEMIRHYSAHAFLFDMELEEQIKRNNHVSEMNKALLENEWIHVVLKLTIGDNISEDEKIKILSSAEMGIHVLKEKSNSEEDVIFTNPYTRKRKLYEYLNYSNTSLSQFESPLKKQRFVEVLQHIALLSGMRNLVLTEAIGE